ncbi:uncharacterized protein LOC108733395 [Agrilus planipennis]|uniref:Uncharacterized protein LOC108733395 n=1 Tax=Agrilus planipennis TaxID=224129 RepID=A0A1W4WIV6_AGRPL|nr:uncharacterized protein LOC108733395 [Agrilus planipennis]
MKMNKQLRSTSTDVLQKVMKSSTAQLLMGAVAGCTTGQIAVKVGRPIALGAGVGVLAIQIASYNGLIKDDLLKSTTDKTKVLQTQYLQKVPAVLINVRQFARHNKPFAFGFLGGLLIGIST